MLSWSCKYREYATVWSLDHAAVANGKPAGSSVVNSFVFCAELKPRSNRHQLDLAFFGTLCPRIVSNARVNVCWLYKGWDLVHCDCEALKKNVVPSLAFFFCTIWVPRPRRNTLQTKNHASSWHVTIDLM